MGFLDRFKPQPKWKHSDRAIRLSAVEALPESEQATLEAISTEDSDAGVRRAAVGKLASVELLARIAREDQDESVRLEAREILVAVAQDSTSPEESTAGLAGLTDARDLAVVARTAELESVAVAALERIDDPRVLAVVARQATHAAIRQAALARVQDPDDLLAIALKSDHRDVGLSALERLTSRDRIDTVAQRARNKSVVRRARAMLRAVEDEERAAQAQAAANAQRLALCEQAETLAQSEDFSAVGDRLAALQAQWQLAGDPADPVLRERWEAAATRVQDLLARSEAERVDAQRHAAVLAAEIAQAAEARIAVCERVEALDGDEAAVGLDEARTVWVALAPWPEAARQSAQARQVDDRFERACEECERRIARHKELGALRAALDELLLQADQAVGTPDIAAARGAWKSVRQAWLAKNGPQIADRARIERWQALEARMQAREADAREARYREAGEHLARVTALCEQVEALGAQPDLPLRDADRLLRDARAILDRPGYFPTKQDQERLVARLRAAYAALQPRLHELKESEDWRRWANATVQEELCAKAEALASVTDPTELAKHLRELQQQWKKVGAAPRERGDDLWKRFKAACDAAWARCSDHFAHQREQEAANLTRKDELCVKAEALADSSDWIRTSEELKRLQTEWQSIGPVPREQSKAVWDRFHAACDTFFTRRKADLAQRKVVWAENQRKKEELCARAEVVAESTEWQTALAEIKQLQADWKAVGPVRRQKAEALWKRFRAACDRFFERYKQRDYIDAAAFASVRETLCGDLEALVPAPGPDGSVDLPDREHHVEAVLSIWRRWQDAPRLPRGVGEPIERRFYGAVDRLFAVAGDALRGTRLDVDANRARMEHLCLQVENLVAGRVTPRELAATPAATLATMLKDALAANTIGGKVDDDTRWRTASAVLRDAQNAWRRLGPVPGPAGRELEARFRRACRRFSEIRQAQQPARAPA
jgi:hypothetical protein